ncbi:hypothetical protein BDV25DRAFT_172725 [Aspergillus avenaceus]|uniref:RRM domain-containing protein n=1 Tax=Aspergillus avenaceus TaxID=36643 RepID=A0A5N6TTP7_ASPAV|nr:hypothetical protein BDV25DRAFT_172725 [Aspergillus avenaceus]
MNSVHITTIPRPRSLKESKQVLSALQKFGEVVTFRNLRYDTTNKSQNRYNRSALAIFESSDAAARAVAASPLIVSISTPSSSTSSSTSTSTSSSTSTSTSTSTSSSTGSSTGSSSNEKRQLTCEILPSRHNHVSALKRNVFHTSFLANGACYQARDLVNTGVPLKMLADEPMARKVHLPLRVKGKIGRENVRWGVTSLMGLWKRGLSASDSDSNSNSK